MQEMTIEETLSKRMSKPEINNVVAWASGSSSNILSLWQLANSEDRLTSVNALWTLTHLHQDDEIYIAPLRNEMIDMLLNETDIAKKRLLLSILKKQEYDADNIRTDFLNYCLSKINSESEPYAIRCFSLYTAFKMCRHFSELIEELKIHLDMMKYQPLSPGLKSALRQTKERIDKLNTV